MMTMDILFSISTTDKKYLLLVRRRDLINNILQGIKGSFIGDHRQHLIDGPRALSVYCRIERVSYNDGFSLKLAILIRRPLPVMNDTICICMRILNKKARQ